ncbi:GTPase Era [Alteromonas sp. 5E99-2]|uniref:GTPase Era n=1 Tax=Alteromonas sp. 5E99-2 TaxID=2817683 RepID=UPI001A9809A3|nr:GTPase Era [Alteromonas sp. 5E99-2]MBO1255305.1 GTPase Era [Alteromonas sp. 5E99-2]
MPELPNTRCGFVAIVGRPNVGKSTLLNQLIGQKVSITSRKPQTTRHRILGIDSQDDVQTVYIDTPGLHQDEKRAINKLMNRAASSTLAEVSLVLFVVEGTRWNDDDAHVLEKLKRSGLPVVLVVNKTDKVKEKTELLEQLSWLSDTHSYAEVFPICAKSGKNVDPLRDYVIAQQPQCEFIFPEEYITDRSSRFMAAEIIREKLMRFTGDELPYSATVEIEQFLMTDNGTLRINGLVLVERETQKRMVIGKGGQSLKKIGSEARKDMENLFEQTVFLELWVKVKSGWADDERALHSLGYGQD